MALVVPKFLPRLILAMVGLVLFNLACSSGGMEPGDGDSEPQSTRPPPEFVPTLLPTQASTPLPAIPERRRVTLEWPLKIRVGDSDVLRLTLEMDQAGVLTPTAEIAGHETRAEGVLIPNLYATHNVLAESRLDLVGLELTPTGLVSQPLLPGERVDFFWSVHAREVGDYRGTVWLYLRFIPLDGGPETQRAISAQVVEIQAVNFLGLGGTPARLLGALGTAIGSLLGLDDLLSWVRRQRKAGLRETGPD